MHGSLRIGTQCRQNRDNAAQFQKQEPDLFWHRLCQQPLHNKYLKRNNVSVSARWTANDRLQHWLGSKEDRRNSAKVVREASIPLWKISIAKTFGISQVIYLLQSLVLNAGHRKKLKNLLNKLICVTSRKIVTSSTPGGQWLPLTACVAINPLSHPLCLSF